MDKHTIQIEDVKVGDWYCFCCEHDLYQINTEKELKELIEDFKDNQEDELMSNYSFWRTKEDALKDLVK